MLLARPNRTCTNEFSCVGVSCSGVARGRRRSVMQVREQLRQLVEALGANADHRTSLRWPCRQMISGEEDAIVANASGRVLGRRAGSCPEK